MSLDLCKRLPVVLPEATMSRTIFRRVAEVLGIAGYCALHATVIPVVISLGTSLAPIDKGIHGSITWSRERAICWHGACFSGLSKGAAQAAGSDLHQVGLARFLAGRLRGGLGRHFFPDLDLKLPLRFEGWNGHGFGAMEMAISREGFVIQRGRAS